MKDMESSVQSYFNGFDGIVLERLHKIRDLVFELLPEAEETIKYGIPTFIYYGNLIHYAGFKHHIGFYPIPSGIEAFKEELSSYKQGKGSVQFPLNEELPIELIKKIVLFRIEKNRNKSKNKKRK
jgi:uncharacterized protein YdhG (YjbR/CyaY superfamily)